MYNFLVEHSQWITFVAGLLTAIVSGFALKSTEQEGLSKKTLATLTLICGMLTAFGSLMSNEDSTIKNEKITVKSDSIKILSLSNSSKLDYSLERLDSIIQKSESQYNKLTLVQKDITENYDKINNGYSNLIDKTNNLKYLISDDFMVQLVIEFRNEMLSKTIDSLVNNKILSEPNFIFYSSLNDNEAIANTIRKKYNKFFVSISIFNKAENYHPQKNVYMYKKNIILHSDFINFSNIPIKPTNTPKLLAAICSYNNSERKFILRIDNLPTKIFSNLQYKSLSEFKKSDITVSVDFSDDENYKNKGFGISLDNNYIIRQLALYHNSNFILDAEHFDKDGKPKFVSFAKFN